ncbi:hypothetical protein V8F20_004040 [Naviculisporaceae sp. PSN 640]
MATPAYNNNGPGMFNAHHGPGDVNANSGPGALFSSDKQDIHYTVHHNYYYTAYPSELPRDMPYALSWQREPPTSHADQRRHYITDPSRSQSRNYDHPPESPVFRPLSTIAASVTRVPDPSNRYSTGRPSFRQTFNHSDRDDDYLPDYLSRRGSRALSSPPASPGLPLSDYRPHQTPNIPTRSRPPRPRPASPILKRTDSGLSGLSRTSGSLASAFGEPPGSPRSSSMHTRSPSTHTSPLLDPLQDSRRLNRLVRQARLAQLYKEQLRRSSIGPDVEREEARHLEELSSDRKVNLTELDMEALRLAILREILAYPVNPASSEKQAAADSGKDELSTLRSPIIALVGSDDRHAEVQEQRHIQDQKQERPEQPRGLSSVAEASSEDLPDAVIEEATQGHRGSVSSISSSVLSPASSTSGGTVWMTSMSSVVLYASAGVLGYHTPFLIQSGILYLRELTVLHGSILRVFYMYESILCSPLVARTGLLLK